MKNFVAILLAAVMLMLLCIPVALAAQPALTANVTVTASKDEITLGESVTFTVTVTNTSNRGLPDAAIVASNGVTIEKPDEIGKGGSWSVPFIVTPSAVGVYTFSVDIYGFYGNRNHETKLATGNASVTVVNPVDTVDSISIPQMKSANGVVTFRGWTIKSIKIDGVPVDLDDVSGHVDGSGVTGAIVVHGTFTAGETYEVEVTFVEGAHTFKVKA